ncbi:MAG: hypothetical protein QOC55_2171, partial [Thermoleophilaceae bacterium]|nr:hypothetical protein [Thermoleophilaceae bacterium]
MVLLLLLVLAGVAAAALAWSGASLAGDPVALAQVHVQPLGGTLQSATASDAAGRPVPLTVDHGKLTPREQVAPGQRISVEVVV